MDVGVERSITYLYGLQSHGIKPGLTRTRVLLGSLGDPHRSFRSIHVGGTNGKGSTAAMIASVLGSRGYRVGLYTSPHLIDFTERIQVNGRVISSDRVGALTEKIRQASDACLSEPPTFFEATTVLAFAYFAEAGVDCAVIEVGLGGRFDATNVLMPLVSVITTIGMDHQEYLGTTPESIAFEKAGIIKQGVPVVAGRLASESLSVIRRTAAEREAACVALGEDFDARGEAPEQFSYGGLRRRYDSLSCSLPGRHQMDNAACALAALELAEARGLAVGEEAVREGLRVVRWPGRLELVSRRPDVWLDGAHNPQAAEALAAYLTTLSSRCGPAAPGCLILVVGMMRDKDRKGVLSRLAFVPGVRHLVVTSAAHPRATDPQELAYDCEGLGVPVAVRPTVAEAFAHARSLAGPDDTICVTGSLLVVGEAKAVLEGTTVSGLCG
ncbi:MAG: bifunctional folylpolyglutamate synthase/dihydrofolate synthase [Nitrospiraceae bacterium]|nr:MAG: bifunctional folylpolyglutamate synthase/dihydrofolate synthase [Nitrospiraceae bacterium]